MPYPVHVFLISRILSVLLILSCRRQAFARRIRLPGQQTLEVGILAVRGMLEDIVADQACSISPVVMTLSILILIST